MRKSTLGVLFVLATGTLVLDRRLAAELPARPLWREELHPLLGAAPEGSFARRPETDPSFLDYRGRAFARRRSGRRTLLLGGARALALVPALEARRPETELVVAAREGQGAVQGALLAGRFAAALDAAELVALDGEELAVEAPPGWTPEWDWHRAALASPLGEALARRSGIARALLVRPPQDGTTRETRRRRYLLDVRATAALAKASGLALLWAFTGDPQERAVAADAAALVRERGGRAFDDPDALVRALGSP